MPKGEFFGGISEQDLEQLLILLHHEDIDKENKTTVDSVRKSWEVVDITAEDVIIRTPSGKFRLQEDINGRLLRLERLFEEENH